MKKLAKVLLVLCTTMALFCISAAAADAPESGIYNVAVESAYTSQVTLTPQKADGTAVTGTAATIDGKETTLYADAVKVQLTYTGSVSSSQYLTVALDDGKTVPTEGNIVYIDQISASGDSVTFTVYPGSLSSGKSYDIYLSSTAGTGVAALTKVASFQYSVAYKLGDIDNNGRFQANDVAAALQMSVGKGTWTANQKLAANADKSADGRITSLDVLYILQASVGKGPLVAK